MLPLVSILIPVYNCRDWVVRAIESALAQTWSRKEIIVLDDGSTDGSIEVIQKFNGRIRIETTENGGQNVSRNRLTALSRGEWLFFLDADDELAPDNVEQKMKHTEKAEAVYGATDVATFCGRDLIKLEKREAVDYSDPLTAAFSWKFPNTSAFAFQRDALRAAGGWDENVKNCTDYALYFPLLLRGGRFKAAPGAWSLYRQWSVTQAAKEAPLRMSTTRLKVMRTAALKLKQAGQMTAAREQAFLDASLSMIRTIYQIDHLRAVQEHESLREWNPRFRPCPPMFSRTYRWAYRSLDFAVVERLAAVVRRLKPTRTSPSQPGVCAGADLLQSYRSG